MSGECFNTCLESVFRLTDIRLQHTYKRELRLAAERHTRWITPGKRLRTVPLYYCKCQKIIVTSAKMICCDLWKINFNFLKQNNRFSSSQYAKILLVGPVNA